MTTAIVAVPEENKPDTEAPERIEEFLDVENGSVVKCIQFNRRGTLLAGGCQDGKIIIWDFLTRGVARTWEKHTGAVSSLSWSKCGRYLLSSSLDTSLMLWDVAKGKVLYRCTLASEVVSARMHPQDPFTCVACTALGPPMLVGLRTESQAALPILGSLPGDANHKGTVEDSSQMSTVAAFSRDGALCYVGTSRGTLNVIEVDTRQVAGVLRVPGGHRITGLSVNRKGTHVVIISFDRVVRVYDVIPQDGGAGAEQGERDFLKLSGELSNSVDKTQWKAAAMSNDDEYVVAAANSRVDHQVFLWRREGGKLTRVLEGPKEGLADMAWHPKKTILCTVASTGTVFVWARNYSENWSAFAPDFKELVYNEEYVEREDEFDVVGAGGQATEESPAAGKDAGRGREEGAGEEGEIDIVGGAEGGEGSDTDDDGSGDYLHFLPISPERDAQEEAEEGPGPGEAAEGAAAGEEGEEDEDGEEEFDEFGRPKRKAKRAAEEKIKEEAAIKTGKRAKFLCQD